MSTTASAIAVRRPRAPAPPAGPAPPGAVGLATWCLWALAAVASAGGVDASASAAGVAVSARARDLLATVATTFLLVRGLKNSNCLMVLPWIMVTTWSTYTHYAGLVKMGTVLKLTRTISKLPWISLGIYLLGLAIRTLLICRVVCLAMKQWCNRLLENHLKNRYPREEF